MEGKIDLRQLVRINVKLYHKWCWDVNLGTKLWLSKLMFKYRLMGKIRPFLRRLYSRVFRRLPSQRNLINSLDFDVLIIYDACRLDYFRALYPRYFKGFLQPALSAGSMTLEWLVNTWYKDRYNIVYVSATPFVKSGKPLMGFNAQEKFIYIEDVWRWGWKESLTTVPPKEVNMAAKLAMTKFKMRGLRLGKHYKLVIHYIQPHAPYLCLGNVMKRISESDIKETIADASVHRLGKVEADKPTVDLLLLVLLKELVRKDKSLNMYLRKLYRCNLSDVMKDSSILIKRLLKKGYKVVISADHGELLGQYGLYFHPSIDVPHLRIVPWFLVESVR